MKRLTNAEIIANITVAKELLKDLQDHVKEATKGRESLEDLGYLYINTELIRRNRLIIQKKLKELERY